MIRLIQSGRRYYTRILFKITLRILFKIRTISCQYGIFMEAVGPALAWRRYFGYIPRRPDYGPRARSSAGEHYVDIVGVTGSIPVAPTSFFKGLMTRPALSSTDRYSQGIPRGYDRTRQNQAAHRQTSQPNHRQGRVRS